MRASLHMPFIMVLSVGTVTISPAHLCSLRLSHHVSHPAACSAKASELVDRASGAAEQTAGSVRQAAKEAAPNELSARWAIVSRTNQVELG